MIQARHTAWAEALFRVYVMRLMRRHFHAFHLLGDDPEPSEELPLLLLPNHSTWWDGFFVYLLNQRLLKRPLYLMMLEEQLRKYRFFSRVGAYSIAPEHPKATLESLSYTVRLLQEPMEPRPLVCWFPQGELLPWAYPLQYKRGLEWLLRKHGGRVNLLPLAIRCEFLNEQRPEAFFLFGENRVLDHNGFSGIEWLAKRSSRLLEELGSRITSGEQGRSLAHGKGSVNRTFDHFRRSPP